MTVILIGALIGFMTGGPFGAILGAFVGSWISKNIMGGQGAHPDLAHPQLTARKRKRLFSAPPF